MPAILGATLSRDELDAFDANRRAGNAERELAETRRQLALAEGAIRASQRDTDATAEEDSERDSGRVDALV